MSNKHRFDVEVQPGRRVTFVAEKIRGRWIPTFVGITSQDGTAVTSVDIRRVPVDRIFDAEIQRLFPLPRPREKTLQSVSQVYNAAVANGAHPNAAVGNAFGISKANASDWIKRSRRSGLIPPYRSEWR